MLNKLLRGLLSACLVAGVTSAFGDNLKQTLMLGFKDGSRVAYFLETQPVLSFQKTELHVVSGDVSMVYPLSDVYMHSFEMVDPSAVTSLGADTESVRVEGDKIVFSGCAKGQKIQVFTSDGKCVSEGYIGNDGNGKTSLSSCPAGLYIVKCGMSTLKMLKK